MNEQWVWETLLEQEKKDKENYILFLECQGRIFIDTTKDPMLKYDNMVRDNAHPVTVLAYIPANPKRIRDVYEFFKPLRYKEKWFNDTDEALSVFARCANNIYAYFYSTDKRPKIIPDADYMVEYLDKLDQEENLLMDSGVFNYSDETERWNS